MNLKCAARDQTCTQKKFLTCEWIIVKTHVIYVEQSKRCSDGVKVALMMAELPH